MASKPEQIYPVPDDMEIAPGDTVGDWKNLQLNDPNGPDWACAIRIFETRIRSRFIDPVDVLIAHEISHERGTFGFSILAIDCLLIETMQGFREGCIQHHGRAKVGNRSRSEELIIAFLSDQLQDWFDSSKAQRFYKECRCAIHHSGQTDGDFRVRRSGPLIEFKDGQVVVNRTAFHEELKRRLNAYLTNLAETKNGDLRARFRKKMNAICGIADETTEVTA